MKERPILFSAPMVRAILAGTKSQTRRIVRPPAGFALEQFSDGVLRAVHADDVGDQEPCVTRELVCPYGKPGDRLWVRETWQAIRVHDGEAEAAPSIPKERGHWGIAYAADPSEAGYTADDRGFVWRPGIHMPRWASRITLEVTGVRVERLQAITEEDARAEGVEPFLERYPRIGRDQRIDGDIVTEKPHRTSFVCLWDEINGDRALFSSNPWVWVIEFRRVEAAARAA